MSFLLSVVVFSFAGAARDFATGKPHDGDEEARVRTLLINRQKVRCRRFGPAARREEGEYPSWIFD